MRRNDCPACNLLVTEETHQQHTIEEWLKSNFELPPEFTCVLQTTFNAPMEVVWMDPHLQIQLLINVKSTYPVCHHVVVGASIKATYIIDA